MNKITKVLLATAILTASQVAAARDWTCHATVSVMGSSATYTFPSWGMSGGILVDRQNRCFEHIRNHFLSSGTLVNLGYNTPDSQAQVCRAGGVDVRVDYGFDERNKSWAFTHRISPECHTNCDFGSFK